MSFKKVNFSKIILSIGVITLLLFYSCSKKKSDTSSGSTSEPPIVTTSNGSDLSISALGGTDLGEIPVKSEVITIVEVYNETSKSKTFSYKSDLFLFELIPSSDQRSKGVNCLDLKGQISPKSRCFFTLAFTPQDRNLVAEIFKVQDQTFVFKARGKTVSSVVTLWENNNDNNGYDFGSILVGSYATTYFSIQNLGSETTQFEMSLISSIPGLTMSETTDLCSSNNNRIPAFGVCRYKLNFAPTTKVNFTNGETYLLLNGVKFEIKGAGLLSGAVVLSSEGTPNGSGYSFDNLPVGRDFTTQITLKNNGDLDTAIFDVALDELPTGISVAASSTDNGCPNRALSLKSGQSCSFTLKITPAAEGDYLVPVVYPGISTSYTFHAKRPGTIGLSPLFGGLWQDTADPIDLGAIVTGVNIEIPVKVINTGGLPVRLEKATLVDSETGIVFSGCPDTLPPAEQCQIIVNFKPSGVTAQGVKNISINYYDTLEFDNRVVSKMDFTYTSSAGAIEKIEILNNPEFYPHDKVVEYIIKAKLSDAYGNKAAPGSELGVLASYGLVSPLGGDYAAQTTVLSDGQGEAFFKLRLAPPVNQKTPTSKVTISSSNVNKSFSVAPLSRGVSIPVLVSASHKKDNSPFETFYLKDSSSPLYFSAVGMADSFQNPISGDQKLGLYTDSNCVSLVDNIVNVVRGNASFGVYPMSVTSDCLATIYYGTPVDTIIANTANLSSLNVLIKPAQTPNPFPINLLIKSTDSRISTVPDVSLPSETAISVGPIRTPTGNPAPVGTKVIISAINGTFSDGSNAKEVSIDSSGIINEIVSPKDQYFSGTITVTAQYNGVVSSLEIVVVGQNRLPLEIGNYSFYSSKTNILNNLWDDLNFNVGSSFESMKQFDNNSASWTLSGSFLGIKSYFSSKHFTQIEKLNIKLAAKVSTLMEGYRLYAYNQSTLIWDLIDSKSWDKTSTLIPFLTNKAISSPNDYVYFDQGKGVIDWAILPINQDSGGVYQLDYLHLDGVW